MQSSMIGKVCKKNWDPRHSYRPPLIWVGVVGGHTIQISDLQCLLSQHEEWGDDSDNSRGMRFRSKECVLCWKYCTISTRCSQGVTCDAREHYWDKFMVSLLCSKLLYMERFHTNITVRHPNCPWEGSVTHYETTIFSCSEVTVTHDWTPGWNGTVRLCWMSKQKSTLWW